VQRVRSTVGGADTYRIKALELEHTMSCLPSIPSPSLKYLTSREDIIPLKTLTTVTVQHMRLITEGQQLLAALLEKKTVLLPYSQKHWENSKLGATAAYLVNFDGGLSGISVAYNGMSVHNRVVDFTVKPATCSCGQPACRHMVCAIRAGQASALPSTAVFRTAD